MTLPFTPTATLFAEEYARRWPSRPGFLRPDEREEALCLAIDRQLATVAIRMREKRDNEGRGQEG